MSPEPVFNMEEALERVDHDRETFQMMTEIFLEQGPKDLREAQVAVSARRPGGLDTIELSV